MSVRLVERLRLRAANEGEAVVAVRAGGRDAISWCELNRRVDAVSAGLRDAFPGGGTVLLGVGNEPGYFAAFLGGLAAGMTMFPVPAESTVAEITSAVRRSGARGAIFQQPRAGQLAEILPGIHPLAGIGPELALRTAAGGGASDPGPGMLLQSSGTTGEPKIVRRSGASLDAVAENMADACGFEPRDRVLAAVPLCHSYGVEHGLLAPVWAGSAVHAVAGFDLSLVLPELRDGGITLLPGVPFMFETLCRAGGAAGPTLRRVYSAGAPLPAAIAGEFRERFRLSIGQVYGATEIGSVTFNNPGDPSFDPAGVGVAMRDVSIRILRSCDSPEEVEPGVEGHVAIRAPSMFDGYLAGEARLVDGHYLTGDLGSVDESGRLRITGRASLLIEVGGRKVNPSEVETALRQHPRVGQCVVVPMRVSESVCRLRAIVTPARPDVEISPGELRAFARQRLSAYKVPRVFEVRAALPMSPAGKVLRQQVETA